MIRGIKRHISSSPGIDVAASLHNRFLLEVIDTSTGKIRTTAEAENVVLNQMWSTYFFTSAWNSYIHYGDGKGTPSPADTSLFGYIGGGSSTMHQVDGNVEERWASFTKMYQLSESVAVGREITEVGIAAGSSSNTLCTHAMLKDMNGNPVSIVKSDTDIINIYSTVYIHWNDIPGVRLYTSWGKKTISGGLSTFAGWGNSPTVGIRFLKGVYGPAAWYNYFPQPTEIVNATVDRDTRSIKFAISRVAIGANNSGGLHHLVFLTNARGDYHSNVTWNISKPWMVIDFPSSQVPGTRVTGESVGTGDGSTTDFTTAFPYTTEAVVYVNGEPATDVVVYADRFTPGYTINDYLEEIQTDRSSSSQPYTGDSKGMEVTHEIVYYNPNYSIGVSTVQVGTNNLVEVSNDMVDWVPLFNPSSNTGGSKAVPEEFRHYKYWRSRTGEGYSTIPVLCNFGTPSDYTSANIHFNTPPAAGSIITADYTTACVAKDSNHVFDLEITLYFNEYAEAQ